MQQAATNTTNTNPLGFMQSPSTREDRLDDRGTQTLDNYQIIRRNGAVVPFEPSKIAVAVMKAFLAQQFAEELDSMNVERRSIEGAMQDEALQLFAQLEWTSENLPPAIVLFNEDWHQGVIGIVAGRLKEKFHRPSIVFAPADDKGEMIKGSARSKLVNKLNLYIFKSVKVLITSFTII